jgi:ABC-type dipeptide/oligopeptide/nickel transport system permease component
MGQYGPGDPVEVQLGQNYSEERAQRIREAKGLNDPFIVQYFRYVKNAIKGDFGESYKYPNKTVSELLKPKLVVSAKLFLASIFITVLLGIPLGFFSALKQGSWVDPSVVAITLVFYAMPVFLVGPVLIIVFSLELGWFPVSGWGGFFDRRMILPAITIGIPGVAVLTRIMRASTLDVLGNEYVRTARAKGLTDFVVNYRHVARNALIPVVTILGFSIAGMLGGALIVELIFGIPGVGRFALDSIFSRDYPVIMALTLIGAISLVIANLVVDIFYVILDPRIRY